MVFPRSAPRSMNAYRIVSPDYLEAGGLGVYRWGSRWISPRRRAVHAAATYSLAVLENLVHWQGSELPAGLLCVVLEIPPDIRQERIQRSALLASGVGDYSRCRELGDPWHERGESAVLWVPSLVSPHEWNVILNQTHTDFSQVTMHGGVTVQAAHGLFPAA